MKPVESEGASQIGADKTVDLIPAESHALNGSEDGDNSLSQGNIHEPEPNTQLGEDGAIDVSQIVVDDDLSLTVSEIIDRFKKIGCLRLRGSTPGTYERVFRLFASAMRLEKFTKRQLAGPKGKELILSYLLDENQVSLASRRLYNASLKSVWESGLGLSYPINSRRDLGELPPVQRRQSPRDCDIAPLVKAIEHEAEPYLKALVLMIVQLGIRPSHARLFRWHHVRYGPDGMPDAIVTSGLEKGNKHYTPVKARLPPDLAEALIDYKKSIPNARPEDPIFPHRKPCGEFEIDHGMTSEQCWSQWLRFEARHRLNHIPPVYLRHWVSTVCRHAGLSYAATNALQGHKFSSLNMRDRYDCPQTEELLEEQARILPHGPIGFAWPKMEVTSAIPAELSDALIKCLRGDMRPTELQERVTAYLVRQTEKKPENTMVA